MWKSNNMYMCYSSISCFVYMVWECLILKALGYCCCWWLIGLVKWLMLLLEVCVAMCWCWWLVVLWFDLWFESASMCVRLCRQCCLWMLKIVGVECVWADSIDICVRFGFWWFLNVCVLGSRCRKEIRNCCCLIWKFYELLCLAEKKKNCNVFLKKVEKKRDSI